MLVFDSYLFGFACACVCVGIDTGVYSGLSACVRMWRPQEGNGCPSLSLSAWHFDVGALSLNLRLVLSWLDWKPAGTSDAFVPVSLGAGVAGSPGHLRAGVAGVAGVRDT